MIIHLYNHRLGIHCTSPQVHKFKLNTTWAGWHASVNVQVLYTARLWSKSPGASGGQVFTLGDLFKVPMK